MSYKETAIEDGAGLSAAPPSMQVAVEEAVKAKLRSIEGEIKERIIAAAVKEFEEKVRETVGSVAINLANYYSVSRMGPEIVISVHLADLKKK